MHPIGARPVSRFHLIYLKFSRFCFPLSNPLEIPRLAERFFRSHIENIGLTGEHQDMFGLQGRGNQLKQSFRKEDFARHGLTAEFIGTDSIKISRGGTYIGHLRKTIGSYRWYPAGSEKPQFRAFTPDKAMDAIVGALKPRGRAQAVHHFAVPAKAFTAGNTSCGRHDPNRLVGRQGANVRARPAACGKVSAQATDLLGAIVRPHFARSAATLLACHVSARMFGRCSKVVIAYEA